MDEYKETVKQMKTFLEKHKNPINENALATIDTFIKQVYESDKNIFNRLYRLEQNANIDNFTEIDNLIIYIQSIYSFVKFTNINEYIHFTNQLFYNMIECDGNYQIIFNDIPRKLIFNVCDDVTEKDLINICNYTELVLSKKYDFTFTTNNIYITHDKINNAYHITVHDKKLMTYYELFPYVERVKSYINNINKSLIKKINHVLIETTKKYEFIKHYVSDEIFTIKDSKLIKGNYLQCFNILHATEYYDVQHKEDKFEIVINQVKPNIKKITTEYIERNPPTKKDPINKYIDIYAQFISENYPGLKPYGKMYMSRLLIELGFINGKNQKFTYWHKTD